ncbi:AfsR/SARP family transcriptional regulator [Cellulomonas marina]|uniref:Predicted ATPase n=1 Tax=Cellulomonas marina TaxID=988821 RepID=A0A1I0Y2U7_9CELL|nr:BTAD domain-containing putative transcriptional regulator [Cellulomonas marina]GIG28409.1 hypothetical protein Cma02nite_10090 [Cellulomonas marina]SFB06940.1 Predicted ATPase [Cellulomonas marina]
MVQLSGSVLGPVRVLVDGRRAETGGPTQSAALAVLLAARGRVVPDVRLVDLLWDEAPPPSALTSLQAFVSRLRRALDPARQGVILREGSGYRVPAGTVTLDADAFEAAVAEASGLVGRGEHARAAAVLEAAARLWTGPAYDGVPRRGPVAAEADRLERLRDAADLLRLEALVRGGNAGRALGELEALTRATPEREDGWRLLAHALYFLDRQADALAALARARAVLRDEHGLDPSPALRETERRILAQDPALAPAAPGPGPAAPTARRAVPAPLTGFVGRRAEAARLAALLDEHRLVTVTGIGGTGKTRLALHVAAARTDADGPWFVDLAVVHDEAVLLDALAAALGVLTPGGLPALLGALAGRTTLLVLDNGEHLREPLADLVVAVLAACPGVRVLVTSRRMLDVDGEVVLDLGPLDPATEAVELFVERARAAAPGWEPGGDRDAAAVATICRELDGLPLALELAAAHCRTLSPAQVAAQLDDRFALLRSAPGGSRARSAARSRGASVEAALDWSVSSLSPAAARLHERAAVFDGGFDLAALAAVAPSGPPHDDEPDGEHADEPDDEPAAAPVLAGLAELVDAGLLAVLRAPDGHRYRMLATVREHAVLHTPPDRLAAARDAHLAWCLRLAAELGPRLRGPGSGAAFARVERETPNVRAALAHAGTTGQGRALRALVGHLGWFWYRRAHVAEGLRWCTVALATPPDEDLATATPADAADRARALLSAGMLAYLAGEGEAVARYGVEAVAWAERAEDWTTAALTLGTLAYVHAYAGDLAAAAAASDRAQTLARRHGPDWALADVLMLRGQLLRGTGDLEGAMAVLDEAIRVAAAASHGWARASALWISAKVALDLDRPEVAAVRLRLQVEELGEDGDVSSWLVGLHALAGAAAALDQAEQGAVLLGAVAAAGERAGFHPEAMDPVDSARTVAAVRAALPEDLFAERSAHGRTLDRDGALSVVRALDVRADEALDVHLRPAATST